MTLAGLAIGTTSVAVTGAHALFSARSSLLIPTIWRAGCAASASRSVALTFDDGPWPGSTNVILDHLRRAGIPATFFVIGVYALKFPDLLRRIHEEGHLLANHTFDHHRTGLIGSTAYWREQITRTDDAIARVTGDSPRYFRPPMGFKSPPLARALRPLGHTLVTWSRRACDGISTTPVHIVRALSDSVPGDIILLHDGRDPASRRDVRPTAVALPSILDGLKSRDLRAERLDTLLSLTSPTVAAATAR